MSELRKVQQTPTGTFFVCLPKDWAKKNGLKKGSLVYLDVTSDGKLLVDSQYNTETPPRNACINLGPHLSREIIGRYLLGYDFIRIETKERIPSDVRDMVKHTVSSLIGLEIVEESSSTIVLQCLLEPSGFLPGKILQRNYAIVAGMTRDAANSFVYGDLHLANNVIARDDESNRLYFLLVRILRTIIQTPRLSEKLGISPIECLDFRLAASLIEGTGDLCVQLAKKTITLNGVKLPIDFQKLLIELQTTCNEANQCALKAFVSKDVSLAEDVRNLQQKIDIIYSRVEQIAKDSSVDLMPYLLAAASFLRQIYERSVDMSDLVV